MDTLDNTDWDVVIVGTSLQQSLLALALSRSGKKILHIDANEYYGGAEAAFSLQEAERWAEHVNADSTTSAFSNVTISQPVPANSVTVASPLRASRAYSLALSPQLIFARSTLLHHLVSSKVYRQLEFLAVGSWWVYSTEGQNPIEGATSSLEESRLPSGRLLKVPNGREDVFQDQVLDFKAKRALMKFLRFISEYEEQPEIWEEHRTQSFPEFLSTQFKVPTTLHAPLLALTLSSASSGTTSTEYALPRIARHLRSIGVFGAGFGSVIPKWGGMSEITQVACRASAVGGGVYVLGKGLDSTIVNGPGQSDTLDGNKLRLKDGETITFKWVVEEGSDRPVHDSACCKSITIVSSPLEPLFPPIAEEAPVPAAATIVFPSGSLRLEGDNETELPPVHVIIHSSDTGECPPGQSILYASTSLNGKKGLQLLAVAVEALLASTAVSPTPVTLWTAKYEQRSGSPSSLPASIPLEQVLKFPSPALDLAFDDSILENVKAIWQKIMGNNDDAGEFLVFEDREANVDEDD